LKKLLSTLKNVKKNSEIVHFLLIPLFLALAGKVDDTEE